MRKCMIPPLLAYQAASVRGTQPLTGVIVTDTFTDTNGVTLKNHTPDVAPEGSSWGGYSIYDGVGTIGSNTILGPAYGIIDSKAFNVTVTLTCTNSGDEYSGIILRGSLSSSDSYHVYVSADDDQFVIMRYSSGGSATKVATKSVTIDAATAYTIVATANGTTISATLDGGNDISYSSATLNLGSTYHGLRIYSGSGLGDYADNFQIEGL